MFSNYITVDLRCCDAAFHPIIINIYFFAKYIKLIFDVLYVNIFYACLTLTIKSCLHSPHPMYFQTRALISKLTDEKNSAIQQSNKLYHELELLRRQGSKSNGGIPVMYVVIIALLGILMGYLMK
ncbi:putative vesicle-associated membrane-protein-associated protein [Helianthus annuus]|nr:putative vesicle-associated membrane-protein-associated protein [Helianthus annuus]KAJ0672986.1 putative vesicle-associated membrane-protein-associated protein [Helianthus annuus]